MAREAFIEKRFSNDTLWMIERINKVLDEHAEMGFTLSLRQIHYALVSRNWMPNTEKDYNRLKRINSDGRMAGMIDWAMVVDRLRLPYQIHTVPDQETALREMVDGFTIDKWLDQPYHIEIMAEKDTETGVLWPVCQELGVSFNANRGYSSQSAMYRAGKRMREAFDRDQKPVILYIGDHDPSGMDMDRDIEERLALFAGLNTVPTYRLALTTEQVEALNPPPNPAKLTDPRAEGYIEKYGFESWETAAIRPNDLADIVRQAILQLRDDDIWSESLGRENELREVLQEHADNFEG